MSKGNPPIEPIYEGDDVVVLLSRDYARLCTTAALVGSAPPGWRPARSRILARHVTRFHKDPELADFVKERLGKVTMVKIIALVRERFGPERTPSRSSFDAFVRRMKAAEILPKSADI